MENLRSLSFHNTDIFKSKGQIQQSIIFSFEDILKIAIEHKAKVIVKPSRSKYWYIKEINSDKSYEDIKNELINNEKLKYKVNTKLWLISY